MDDISKDVERCQEYAIDLRGRGYNCAQCVLMSLSDRIGVDKDTAAKITVAFGSGFAATGEICGAVSSLGVAVGLAENDSSPTAKVKTMKLTKEMFDRFKEENGGRFRCRDLKGKADARSCPDLIRQSISIFIQTTENAISQS